MRTFNWVALVLGMAAMSAHAERDLSGPLNPPEYIGPAVGYRSVTNRALTMVSSMAVSPEGRLWVTWYAGPTPGEDRNNYVVLATSGDDGATWEEVLVVDPDEYDEPLRAFDPEIWVDPMGRLWLIWAQAVAHGINAQTWVLIADDPESPNPEWHEPRLMAPGVMMCKPIVLSDGTWLFPISDWEGRRLETPDAATAGAWVSTDHGETFTLRGAALVPVEHRTFDEHMFVERKDGSIWLLARTRYGIGESVSTDGGVTWPEVTPSNIPHPAARFFIERLQSGNLLLVKHGPMDERTRRSHLMAFISTDDGHSWEGGLLLDERTGISYPDGQQAADGTIYITYDYDRRGARHILFASFREEDAAAGEAVSNSVRLRQLVSQGTGGQERRPQPAQTEIEPPRDQADGAELRRYAPGVWAPVAVEAWAPGTVEALPLERGATLFSDRNHRAADIPDALHGAHFLRMPIEGEKTIQAARAGTVYFLTPEPDRNHHSQTQVLLDQGFEKVAVPEVPLFFHQPGTTRNYCTLYQKDVATGETITFGMWAVPVFWP